MARDKLTKKEIVMRMLHEKCGQWVYGYDLQGKHTKWGFSGIDADTRAHELARAKTFNSDHFTYTIEHEGPFEGTNKTRYARFRISKKEPRFVVNGRRNYTMEALYA